MHLNQVTLLQTIRQYKLFPPNSRVLVAVSGGADSLALLHLLAQLRLNYPFSLAAASLNHGIRPEAAEEQAFVQEMANLWNLPSILGHADVPAIAEAENLGIETAARKARYDFLAKSAAEFSADFVATAHHADDQIETILMHIVRGSGIKGLMGMSMHAPLPFHRQHKLIRPLLLFSRENIEAYCAEFALNPRHDPSNSDTQIFRNAIRHEIVPRLRQINPQIDTAFARLAQIASAEEDYLQEEFENKIKPQIFFSEQSVRILRTDFASWHRAMQRRGLVEVLTFLGVEANFERIDAAITTALNGTLGAIVEFNGLIRLRIDYDYLYIENYLDNPINSYDSLQISNTELIKIPSIINFDDFELIISNLPLDDFTANLLIPNDAQILLRTRRAGDIFRPLGMAGQSRKLKKWFIDRKIPQNLRDNIPLLEVNGEIAAIILPESWAISETFAVQTNSQHIIYFKVKKL